MPMIEFLDICSVFGSRMKALEVLCVLNNRKAVVRQGFYPHELTAVEVFCKKNNLFIEKSRNKVALNDTEHFTNRGRIVSAQDQGLFFVYISKDELKSVQACLSETLGDHYATGLMLGYPECCVRFFCEQFKNGNLNPVHKPLNPWTNLIERNNDACLLSHFPCSNDCKESISIAQMNAETLRKADENAAQEWIAQLAANIER